MEDILNEINYVISPSKWKSSYFLIEDLYQKQNVKVYSLPLAKDYTVNLIEYLWSWCILAHSRVQSHTAPITTDEVPTYTPEWKEAHIVKALCLGVPTSTRAGIEPTIIISWAIHQHHYRCYRGLEEHELGTTPYSIKRMPYHVKKQLFSKIGRGIYKKIMIVIWFFNSYLCGWK